MKFGEYITTDDIYIDLADSVITLDLSDFIKDFAFTHEEIINGVLTVDDLFRVVNFEMNTDFFDFSFTKEAGYRDVLEIEKELNNRFQEMFNFCVDFLNENYKYKNEVL